MKSKPMGALFGVLALVAILAIAPSAFAAQTVEVSITTGAGNQNPPCVATKDCFTPNPVQIAPGDTVKWTNTDSGSGSTTHTVTSGHLEDNDAGSLFTSGDAPLKKGQTYSFTFNNPGTYDYFCMIHPWMAGQVIVAASATSPPTNNGTSDNNTVPEFGSIAPIVLAIAVISTVVFTARNRGIPKL
ncbi:MAG: PEFG-CTERM sorting domain-containing protein [Thaumarchaeota archaeon]|nr:MAG: PEFG-CTERM sorting domain-containing protein [Nitrososphaerota archaeon]TLX94673.1 MAG: PEFG-CTERM sorting domain-containing protein [Nitrososphaerota archaeon]